MTEPVWLDLEVVLAIHDEQLAEHGGQPGVSDRGLLESAVARPRNQYAYGEHSLARVAASYAFGISRNHPFLDGNERTSLVVAELFLELNGSELTATDAQCVTTFLQLAAGDLTEDQLADWIAAAGRRGRDYCQKALRLDVLHYETNGDAPGTRSRTPPKTHIIRARDPVADAGKPH